jgi:hypothetical protein
MKTLTKVERRKNELERHYKALEALALKCGVKADGKKLSLALWKLELKAHKAAEDYCNGVIDGDAFDGIAAFTGVVVQGLFQGNLEGLKINGDPRGYALKIDDAVFKEKYFDTGITRDWGGYGILSPEIEAR